MVFHMDNLRDDIRLTHEEYIEYMRRGGIGYFEGCFDFPVKMGSISSFNIGDYLYLTAKDIETYINLGGTIYLKRDCEILVKMVEERKPKYMKIAEIYV